MPTPSFSRPGAALLAAALLVGSVALLAPSAHAQGGCDPGAEIPVPSGLASADLPTGSVRRAETALGTTLALGASGVPCEEATAAFAEVFAEFHRLEVLTSLDHPESELRLINEAAGKEPVPVGLELFDLIKVSLRYAELSGGAFDPTFAAMDGLWKFEQRSRPADEGTAAEDAAAEPAAPDEGAAADGASAAGSPAAPAPASRVPNLAEIDVRLGLVDHTKVILDEEAQTVFLSEPGMVLSLGGIAKGYATDRAVDILRRRHIPSFIIRSGGEMFIEGDPGGGDRRIGVPDPRGPGAFALVEVRGRALNISTDSKRFFIEGGVRYHHIIDPRTGFPAHHVRTVAVTAPSAMAADALSTAVFVLGPRAGLDLIERTPGAEVILVDGENRVHISSGFGPRLEVRAPTDQTP